MNAYVVVGLSVVEDEVLGIRMICVLTLGRSQMLLAPWHAALQGFCFGMLASDSVMLSRFNFAELLLGTIGQEVI